jgi:hypothetical protein
MKTVLCAQLIAVAMVAFLGGCVSTPARDLAFADDSGAASGGDVGAASGGDMRTQSGGEAGPEDAGETDGDRPPPASYRIEGRLVEGVTVAEGDTFRTIGRLGRGTSRSFGERTSVEGALTTTNAGVE